MLSFFRRKKPQDAPATEAPKTQHYSAEELAAAFPSAAPVDEAPAAPLAAPTPAPAPVAVPEAPAAAPAPPAAERVIAAEDFEAEALAAAAVLAPLAPVTPAEAPAAPAADLPVLVDAAPAPAGKPGWRERLRNSVIARSFGGLWKPR
ncbi:hypothetical protein G6F32_016000 [Rhizopus arrhizus]|nr:hypothetical protein G6F32_016000 [Rhizopus arrhizus]